MTVSNMSFMAEYMAGIKRSLDSIPAQQMTAVAEMLLEAYRHDRMVAVLGNGGSAATASHMACDMGKTILGTNFDANRPRFRVMALNDNMPLITAWANDVAYERVFAEQVRTWMQAGDMLIVISGSGNSANVVAAVEAARERGVYTIGFLGFSGGMLKDMVDYAVTVPSNNYGYIEDVHMIFVHMLTAYIREVINSDKNWHFTAGHGDSYDESAHFGGWRGYALAASDLAAAKADAAD
ncbi:MAG: SIS domain-containing protein [Caldilineaceae bacterium]